MKKKSMLNKGFLKNVFAMMLSVAVLLQCMTFRAEAATGDNGRVPITAYLLQNENSTTYWTAGGNYAGYIEGADECKILSVGDDGWCKVEYPISMWRKKQAYAPSSAFFADPDFKFEETYIGSNMMVYRRADLSVKLGEVYGDDPVIITGYSQGNTQILYPLDNHKGYKLGFVRGMIGNSSGVRDGYYEIASALDTRYVADVYKGRSGYANLALYRQQLSLNQIFLIKKELSGYYTITAMHSGDVLDVEGGRSFENSCNVIQYPLNQIGGTDNQLWCIEKTDDGCVRIRSKINGMYLCVSGASAGNDVNLEVRSDLNNDDLSSRFVLTEYAIDGKCYSDTVTDTAEQRIQKLIDYEIDAVKKSSEYGWDYDIYYNKEYYGGRKENYYLPWCQAFQTIAARDTGLSQIIPCTASCLEGVNYFKERDQFHLADGTYTPQKGDLVFYGPKGGSHVGLIVADPVDSYLQVIEGNTQRDAGSDYGVVYWTHNEKRKIGSDYIYGYGSPDYSY